MSKPTKLTCLKCGKPAVGRFTPDLDIRGVGFCKRHKIEIWLDIWITMEDGKVGKAYFYKKYFGKKKRK